jgi:ABC-type polysaccharide/polyol phosphate transport system ATPase subunit
VCLDIPLHGSDVRTLKRALLSGLTGGRLAASQQRVTVKALDRICLEIHHGDRLGLIGHNGAGKSTFLRLLSGILEPTSGVIDLAKPFTPLIDKSFLVEPQLTGSHALKAHYLMHRRSLMGFDHYVEDVVSFSDLGNFLELPLDAYSEGMKTRLLFAIHTYFTHDLLALDEGIGAGDRAFLQKAAIRMEQFLSRSGTLLLASHSEEMLRRFCNKILVFEKGSIVFSGNVADGLAYYRQARPAHG